MPLDRLGVVPVEAADPHQGALPKRVDTSMRREPDGYRGRSRASLTQNGSRRPDSSRPLTTADKTYSP